MAENEQLQAKENQDFKAPHDIMLEPSEHDYGLKPLKHMRHCDKCGKETVHFGFSDGAYCAPCGDKNAAKYETEQLAKKNALDKAMIVDILGVDIDVARKAMQEAKEKSPDVWLFFDKLEKAIVEGVGMFMCGDKGTGKTTIAGAILMKASKLNKSIGCIKALDITSDLTALKYPKILVIDEIHKAVRMYGDRANDDDVNRLYRLIDYRRSRKLSTICISNESGEELRRMFGGAITDRIKDNSVYVSFKGESFRKPFSIGDL